MSQPNALWTPLADNEPRCANCGELVPVVDLWLVPVTPPGPWVDACSGTCGRRLYEQAVLKNCNLDNALDVRIIYQRDVPLHPPKLRLDAPEPSDLI